MAYTFGTAANYKDLLAIMVTFAAANGWTVLEQSATRVYLRGEGLAGLDEIYCGVETYEDPVNGRYNWSMVGSWGYRAGRALNAHPMSSNRAGTDLIVGHFWNAAMPYWMVCTPRRIIVCAKVGTTYQMVYLGLLTPPATDAQYPYPLFIGGSGKVLTQSYADALNVFWNATAAYYVARISLPGGTWGSQGTATQTPAKPLLVPDSVNRANRLNTLTALDGSYLLDPIYYNSSQTGYSVIAGQLDGLFQVTGYNNSAENIITVGGVNYMVFPDGSKSGYGDYCAMRLN